MGRITASQGYPHPDPYHLWIHYTWHRRIMMPDELKIADHLAYSRKNILERYDVITECLHVEEGSQRVLVKEWWERCHTEAIKMSQGHSLINTGAPQKLEEYRRQFSPTVPRTRAESPTFGQRPSDNSFGLCLPEVKKPVGSWSLVTAGIGNRYTREPTDC